MVIAYLNTRRRWGFLFSLLFLTGMRLTAENYSDRHHVSYIDRLGSRIASQEGICISPDSTCLMLADSATHAFVIFEPDTSEVPFNRGLPSWNGTVSHEGGGFLVKMRFPSGAGWSPWLTVGFWQDFIWDSYGATSYSGGFVDYDYVKLYQYHDRWQFGVVMTRKSVDDPSPTLHKLSFFISDSRTTSDTDYSALLNDSPEEVFIPTDFFYQYAIDDQIGGSICSPTSVSMALRSYEIPVDPLQFARDTRDPVYGIFGIWPRVVQNASEYGVDGAVTRYRSWSAAREVLAQGGRIVISVGPPLYEGHLMMLAGFTAAGNPIVHDPARQSGYSKIYDKDDLARSWFGKGGISYTFFPSDSQLTDIAENDIAAARIPETFLLHQNYPNPFNPVTTIPFSIPARADVTISVYDIHGRLVEMIHNQSTAAGYHSVAWHAEGVSSGQYFIVLRSRDVHRVIRAILIR